MRTALDADPERLDGHEQKFVANVREHGWFGTHVFGDDQGPEFTFTTGFWLTLGCPELIAFSLKRDTAHDIFWTFYRAMQDGTRYNIGSRVSDILTNLDIVLIPVDKGHYRKHLGWSRWFYAGDEFPCWQLVWPDRANRFPWDHAADPSFRDSQPDLSSGNWGGLSLNS